MQGYQNLIEIAGKQIELPNIMWEPVPEGMELYFVQALHQYDTKNMQL